jgi:hypothetical protein
MASAGAPSCPLQAGHVTSAIPEMTVANIRKGLLVVRIMYNTSTREAPMFVCDALFEGLTVQEFAMRLVLGQHLKRHGKSQLQRAAVAHFQQQQLQVGGAKSAPASASASASVPATATATATVRGGVSTMGAGLGYGAPGQTPSLALGFASLGTPGRLEFLQGLDSAPGGVVTVVDGTVVPPTAVIPADARSTLYVLTRMTA